MFASFHIGTILRASKWRFSCNTTIEIQGSQRTSNLISIQ